MTHHVSTETNDGHRSKEESVERSFDSKTSVLVLLLRRMIVKEDVLVSGDVDNLVCRTKQGYY